MAPPVPRTDPRAELKRLEVYKAKIDAAILETNVKVYKARIDAAIKETDRRVAAASFTPGPGLALKGSPAHQTKFLNIVRREMAVSPSFFNLMQSLNGDVRHRLEVTVSRNSDFLMDSFDSVYTAGQQEVDLADLEMLPANPPADFPHAATRGEILAHAMAEARGGAQGEDYKRAHDIGIKAQNDYRDDRGQKGHRGEGGVERNAAGNRTINYDNGYWEVWVMDGSRITRVDRHHGTPPPPRPWDGPG